MVNVPPKLCSWQQPFVGSYLEFAIVLPTIIVLQLLLLFWSLYYEYNYAKKKSSLKLRITFILIQLIAIWWILCDLLRFVIDPYSLIIRNNILCHITAHSPRIISIIYYGIYLYQILMRLYLSFKDSVYCISKNTMICLSLFIIIPLFVIPISFIPFAPDVCIWEWTPNDLQYETISICSSRNIGVSNIIIIAGILWVAVANIIFGIIFSMKLSKVLNSRRLSISGSNKQNFKLKSLIIKNYILTIIGSISTVTLWICWVMISNLNGGIGAFFIYIDVYLNIFMLALMLNYNEKYYKQLCKCCIIICFVQCDKSIDRKTSEIEMEQQQKYIDKYLNDKIDLSAIFSKTGTTGTATPTSNNNNNQNQQHRIKSLGDVLSDVDNNTHCNLGDDIDIDLSDNDKSYNQNQTNLIIITPPISPIPSQHETSTNIIPLFNITQNSNSKPIIVD